MSVRIISWDVGVIHLAYCVLELKDSQITIIDWNEINLVEHDRMQFECKGMTKRNKICGKKASYYVKTNTGEKTGYCKTHLSQYTESDDMVDVSAMFKEVEESPDSGICNTCTYLKKNGSLCGKKAKYMHLGKKKAYYCNTHYKSQLNKKIKEYSPHPIKNLIIKKYPTSQLQINLVNKLDKLIKHFALLGVTEVVIENQPSMLNPKMKSLANTLFDYFLIRGYTDQTNGFKIQMIKLMSPSNKLKVDADNTLKVLKGKGKGKNKYKLTKELGLQYTRQLLADSPDELDFLNSFTKKDDLCDAYLQGRYYLEFHRKNNIVFDRNIKKSLTESNDDHKPKPKDGHKHESRKNVNKKPRKRSSSKTAKNSNVIVI